MPTPLQSARMARDAYLEQPLATAVGDYRPFLEEFDVESGGTGFTAHAFWSPETDSLVIAFAGTDPSPPYEDLITDLQLALTGRSNQTQQALDFANRAIAEASQWADGEMQVTVTGDSLGGWLALQVADRDPSVHAVAFNAPGFRGIDPDEFPKNAELYYNNPMQNDLVADLVHDAGVKSYRDAQFVMGGSGHSIDSLIEAWENGSLTLSLEEYTHHVTNLLDQLELPAEGLAHLLSIQDREFEAAIEQAIENSVAPNGNRFLSNLHTVNTGASPEDLAYLENLAYNIITEEMLYNYELSRLKAGSCFLSPGSLTYTQNGFGWDISGALTAAEIRQLMQNIEGKFST